MLSSGTFVVFFIEPEPPTPATGPQSYTPKLAEYLAFRLKGLERDRQSGKLSEEAFAKEKLLILSRYPEVGSEIAKEKLGKNEQSAEKNLQVNRKKRQRIRIARIAAYVGLFVIFVVSFYLLGLPNSRYAEQIHWERTIVAVIGAFAVAFLAGIIHAVLKSGDAKKEYGHFVLMGAIAVFAALNQGILYNPFDPALAAVDEEFSKPTLLSHVGILVVTVSTLIVSGLAVVAGFVSAGISTLPKMIVEKVSAKS